MRSRFGAYKAKSEEEKVADGDDNPWKSKSDSTTVAKEPSVTDREEQGRRFARDLEQWLRKMRCSGVTMNRLDTFRDIKVGVCPDEVDRGAPSVEPFPSRYRETEEYKFKGGRNAQGNFQVSIILCQSDDVIYDIVIGPMCVGTWCG